MVNFRLSQPAEVVNLTDSVYQTFLGHYFFGQTEPLTFGGGDNAWGGLINPADSGVNMFWNVFTVSNFSVHPFTAEIWLNSTIPGTGRTSIHVACANQAIVPVPQPKVEIQFADRLRTAPSGGYFSFIRRVEPNVTLTRHDFQGMIIIPPGGSAIAFIRSPGPAAVKCRIAFGWWEQHNGG